MTDNDLDDFSVAFRHLGSVLLPVGKSINSDMLMDAFRDLQEFPLATVVAALEKVRRSARFFPKPAVLIDTCRELAHVGSIDRGGIPDWVDHNGLDPKYFCDLCRDTGFVRDLHCDGYGACHTPGCGKDVRRGESHDYTRKCSCRRDNPVLVYERTKQRRSPEELR